jgi:hypothetical protein
MPLAVIGPHARVLALQHLNSVCRGSIVSRANRTSTAFGVSAGVLAQGQCNHSTPLRALARLLSVGWLAKKAPLRWHPQAACANSAGRSTPGATPPGLKYVGIQLRES